MTNLFVAPQHAKILTTNQLNDFDSIWNLKVDWFEEPNMRRGGWSGVGQFQLKYNELASLDLFVKKQQNHGRRTLFHPILGEPTFRREFQRLKFLEQHHFAAPKVVFYAESNVDGKPCAILMTEALSEYVPLDSLSAGWRLTASRSQQSQLTQKIAIELRRFHNLGLVHRALYPKHIFVKNAGHSPDIALIDLEKARFSLWFAYRAFFDLAALNRHAEGWRSTQRLAFFLAYMNIKKLNFFSKLMCRLIVKRAKR